MKRRPETESGRVYFDPGLDSATGREQHEDASSRSFNQALDEAKRRFDELAGQRGPGGPSWHLDIICGTPETTKPRPGKPSCQLYVNATATDDDGDGREATPCPGIDAALDSLREMRRRGQLSLRPGERCRLTHREVFAATTLEIRRIRRERLARSLFAVTTALLVIPVVVILGYLVIRAWPVLSPASFSRTRPTV